MQKCMASQDGICKNAYAFGLRCDGYSTKCKLKPAYDSLGMAVKGAIQSIRRTYGIVSDKEDE